MSNTCDVCNRPTSWETGTGYTADEFRDVVGRGFEPDEALLHHAAERGISRAVATRQCSPAWAGRPYHDPERRVRIEDLRDGEGAGLAQVPVRRREMRTHLEMNEGRAVLGPVPALIHLLVKVRDCPAGLATQGVRQRLELGNGVTERHAREEDHVVADIAVHGPALLAGWDATPHGTRDFDDDREQRTVR